METTYRNKWFNPKDDRYGPRNYTTWAEPEEYKGYLIYHRIDSVLPIESGAHVFDVVKDGTCIGQYAGPNGARRFIDTLTEE